MNLFFAFYAAYFSKKYSTTFLDLDMVYTNEHVREHKMHITGPGHSVIYGSTPEVAKILNEIYAAVFTKHY